MIIIDSVSNPAELGRPEAVLTLFADTKSEVPETGVATAALIPGYKGTLLPTSILYTAALDIAVLNTSDTWVWKE